SNRPGSRSRSFARNAFPSFTVAGSYFAKKPAICVSALVTRRPLLRRTCPERYCRPRPCPRRLHEALFTSTPLATRGCRDRPLDDASEGGPRTLGAYECHGRIPCGWLPIPHRSPNLLLVAGALPIDV